MSYRSSFRSTFIIYNGDPTRSEAKQCSRGLRETETRAQFNKKVESIEQQCQMTQLFLQKQIRRWQMVCHLLNRESERSSSSSPSSLPLALAAASGPPLLGNDHSMSGEYCKAGIVRSDVDSERSQGTCNSKPFELSHSTIPIYCVLSAVRPSNNFSALCFLYPMGKIAAYSGVNSTRGSLAVPLDPISSTERDFIELAWDHCEDGLAWTFPHFQIVRRASVESRVHALKMAVGSIEVRPFPTSTTDRSCLSRESERPHEVPAYLSETSSYGSLEKQEMEGEEGAACGVRPVKQAVPVVTLARLLAQDTPALLSVCENLLVTALGSHFLLLSRTQRASSSADSDIPSRRQFREPSLSNQNSSSSESYFDNTFADRMSPSELVSSFDDLAAVTTKHAPKLLSPILLHLRDLFLSPDLYPKTRFASQPILFVRFMHICLLAGVFWSKRQDTVTGRLWLDLAFWMSRNGSFAAHIPLFDITKARIDSFVLECGPYGGMEWLGELDSCAADVSRLSGTPRSALNLLDAWVVQGSEKMDRASFLKGFTWTTCSTWKLPDVTVLLDYLVEHHVLFFKKDWVCTAGEHHWEWIDERKQIMQHSGVAAKAGAVNATTTATPTPIMSSSATVFESPSPSSPLPSSVWDSLETGSTTDSSETMSVLLMMLLLLLLPIWYLLHSKASMRPLLLAFYLSFRWQCGTTLETLLRALPSPQPPPNVVTIPCSSKVLTTRKPLLLAAAGQH